MTLFYNISAFIAALIIVWRNIFVDFIPSVPFMSQLYYGSYIFFALFFILFDLRRLKFNVIWLPFYFIAILSIISGNPAAIFRPWERFLSFTIASTLLGPLLESPRLNLFRQKLFQSILFISTVACIASFILWASGNPNAFQSAHLIKGFFGHSMLLSPLCSILILELLRRLFLKKTPLPKRLIYFILLGVFFILLLLSASRAAFLALLAGLFAFLLAAFWTKKQTLALCTLLLVTATASTFPLWNPYLENMQAKMDRDNVTTMNEAMNSRAKLWDERIRDFHRSPLLGSGFASVHLTGPTYSLKSNAGIVEPGNGWLFILSSTGILGLLCLIFPLLSALARLFRHAPHPMLFNNTPNHPLNNTFQQIHPFHLQPAYLFAILIFFIIHSFAEGYVISSGAMLFSLFWLYLGLSEITLHAVQHES